MDDITTKIITGEKELSTALALVWEVFEKFEAPEYSKEGTEEFFKSIHDEAYLRALTVYGAYMDKKLLGVLATRSGGTHIALFFVDGRFMRRGIGKRLFKEALKNDPSPWMTVNSSPYALEVYHRLGFKDTDREQTVNGLRFTPMKYTCEKEHDHD